MQKVISLNDGNSIPTVGLGTWKSPKDKVGQAVEFAIIEAGYRHIDCASIYGNEEEIGEGLSRTFVKVKREHVFITSKLWNTDHDPDQVEKACCQTLEDLNLEYLDLYLMHWGYAFVSGEDLEPIGADGKIKLANISIRETWQAMEQLVKKGIVKSIGVANFTTMMLVDLLTYAEIIPVMNQIELHPYNTQEDLIAYCNYKNISVTAYSPLGHEVGDLFEEQVIKRLAGKYKRTRAQILLNWAVGRGTIVIPKTTSPERLRENIDIFNFEMTKDEIKQIADLNKNHRFVDPMEWWGIPYYK